MLAKAADLGNPHTNQVLTVPPAWQAGTAYTITPRSVVANAGSWYICRAAGTSAGSGGPTTTNSALPIADGSASWLYLGPARASADDPLAPTVTYASGEPGDLPQFVTPVNSLLSFRVYGARDEVISGSFYLSTIYNDVGVANSATDARVAFMTDAPKIAIAFYSSSGSRARIFIDDRLYSIEGVTLTTGFTKHIVLDFGAANRRNRKIVIQGSAFTFGGVRIDGQSSVWAPDKDSDFRAAIISDSLFVSTAVSNEIRCGESTATILAKMLGWNDCWNFSRGGTGYVKVATGSLNFKDRMAQVIAQNPELYVFAGSGNDAGLGQQITDSALACYRQIRASGSRAPIIVIGVLSTDNAAFAAVELAIKAAFDAFDDTAKYWIPIINDPTVPWITGAWNNSNLTTRENASMYIGSDNVHLSDLGAEYFAERCSKAIRSVVYPALL